LFSVYGVSFYLCRMIKCLQSRTDRGGFSLKREFFPPDIHETPKRNRAGIVAMLITLSISVLFFSCEQDKKVTIPVNVLPQAKMAQVIKDVHLAEAEINLNSPPPALPGEQGDTVPKRRIDFEKIFESNKITRSQYDTSIYFYIAHPQLLDTIYVQVLNELSKMQSEK